MPRARAARVLLLLGLVAAGAMTVPRALCGHAAGPLFDGEQAAQEALARSVAAYVRADVGAASFHTGVPRYDGEWAFGTHQMAALGLGQVALSHPALRPELLPVIERCAERLLEPAATAFGTEAWRERGLDHLEHGHGHGYLGYLNLALGMLRLLDRETRFAATHDRLTGALARRLAAAPHGLFETYPGETYPPDMAVVAGSLALHGRATGASHQALLASWARVFRARAVDPRSGLVYQAAHAGTGQPAGPPRASGTAISVYALSFVDMALSRELFEALRRGQRRTLLGFGGMREYTAADDGRGDIDSGPVVLGLSVSGTGFALAGARLHGDRGLYTELYRTADLFGVPLRRDGGRRFLSGGPLGNAILLAMLTAAPERR